MRSVKYINPSMTGRFVSENTLHSTRHPLEDGRECLTHSCSFSLLIPCLTGNLGVRRAIARLRPLPRFLCFSRPIKLKEQGRKIFASSAIPMEYPDVTLRGIRST